MMHMPGWKVYGRHLFLSSSILHAKVSLSFLYGETISTQLLTQGYW